MGFIQRQSFRHALVTFGGMALGAVNMLFLYPKVLTQTEYGIFQYIVRNAQMLFPFCMLGAAALVIRFFPHFRDAPDGRGWFLSFTLRWAFAGFAVFTLLAVLLHEWLFAFFEDKRDYEYYRRYLPYLLPITISIGLAYLLSAYSANFRRIVVPALFSNFYLKLTLGLLVVAVWLGWMNFDGFINGATLLYASVVVLTLIYLAQMGRFSLRPRRGFPDRGMLREMMSYSSFSLLGGIGVMLASQIDVLMVGLLIELNNVAVYSIALPLADAIDVPRRSIEQITAPQVAQAWQDDDRGRIGELYHKSAVTQLAAGLLLMLCIATSLDPLFALIPNGDAYAAGKAVVLILGLGKLFDLMGGINRLVIIYSPLFRFEFYATLALAVLNVVSNFLFIPLFAEAGAALATAFTILVYTLLKVWFVWSRFRLQPFSRATLWLFLLAGAVYLVVFLIPDPVNPLFALPLNVAVAGGLYGLGIFWFRLAPELTSMIENGLWEFLRR
jgi:O-antigen/teichoic acid export membrane protein